MYVRPPVTCPSRGRRADPTRNRALSPVGVDAQPEGRAGALLRLLVELLDHCLCRADRVHGVVELLLRGPRSGLGCQSEDLPRHAQPQPKIAKFVPPCHQARLAVAG
jgi:hypothetical protein